jgi:hypothetical protein
VLYPPALALYLVSSIYCVMALVAVGGGAVVRRLWTASREQSK